MFLEAVNQDLLRQLQPEQVEVEIEKVEASEEEAIETGRSGNVEFCGQED